MGKRGAVVATSVATAVVVALPAWAYFALTSTTTNASVTAAALGTPVTGTPAATTTSVSFTVAAPTTGPAPTGYRVDRTAPTAVAGVCAFGTAAGGTCTDSSPVGGQTNSYSVYALRGQWASVTPAAVAVAVPAEARSYTVTPATTTPTAGTAFNVTITAKSGSATDTAYSGTKTLTWSGGQTIGAFAPVYAGSVAFTNGVGTASVTLHKAGAQTLVVTDANTTAYTGSAAVTVAAALPRLSFSTCTSPIVKNSSFTTSVTRTGADPYGNSTGTAAVTVTLAPFHATQSNDNFTTASVTLGAGVLTSATVTYETANGADTKTLTATATGYTAASCTVTTTN